MIKNIKNTLLAVCLLASPLTLADNTPPPKPDQCPDLKLIQQKKAFFSLIRDSRFTSFFQGATQIDNYGSKSTWLIEVGDALSSDSQEQAVVNQAQKILEGAAGNPSPEYNAKDNVWRCTWDAQPGSMVVTHYLEATFPVPHYWQPVG